MKKLLFASICLLALPVMAQKAGECALTPLQNLIVNARGAEEIQALIQRGVVFDEQVRCGGSLMQLAIRRGNPAVLEAILRQDQTRANATVTLEAFPILGAPKQIPLILFAAYYAPNETIVKLLKQAGANIAATDDFGRNLLWYLGKNPVLRNTALQDELNNELLYGMVASQAQGSLSAPAQGSLSAPAQGSLSAPAQGSLAVPPQGGLSAAQPSSLSQLPSALSGGAQQSLSGIAPTTPAAPAPGSNLVSE